MATWAAWPRAWVLVQARRRDVKWPWDKAGCPGHPPPDRPGPLAGGRAASPLRSRIFSNSRRRDEEPAFWIHVCTWVFLFSPTPLIAAVWSRQTTTLQTDGVFLSEQTEILQPELPPDSWFPKRSSNSSPGNLNSSVICVSLGVMDMSVLCALTLLSCIMGLFTRRINTPHSCTANWGVPRRLFAERLSTMRKQLFSFSGFWGWSAAVVFSWILRINCLIRSFDGGEGGGGGRKWEEFLLASLFQLLRGFRVARAGLQWDVAGYRTFMQRKGLGRKPGGVKCNQRQYLERHC